MTLDEASKEFLRNLGPVADELLSCCEYEPKDVSHSIHTARGWRIFSFTFWNENNTHGQAARTAVVLGGDVPNDMAIRATAKDFLANRGSWQPVLMPESSDAR